MSVSFSLVPYSGGPSLVITDEAYPSIVAPSHMFDDGVPQTTSLAVRRHPGRDDRFLVCGTIFHADKLVATQGDIVPEERILEMLKTVAMRMHLDDDLVDRCQKGLDRLHIG
jgi:hypothetical protein